HLDHKTAARGSRFAFNDCHDAPLPYSALLLKSRSWPGRRQISAFCQAKISISAAVLSKEGVHHGNR
ncbi:hypothetical protein QCD79_31165, partial [Pseudomonas quasicaspiana]|nr:hypothetical protein [Pseudomonas quasicaspiana]